MWNTIREYSSYQVNEKGQVRSLCRYHNSGIKIDKIRILKPHIETTGYQTVHLYRKGNSKSHYIHRLVMAAFTGPCPKGKEVNHKNGVKTDNRLANLEYVTPAENVLHAFRMGLIVAPEPDRKAVYQFTKDGRFIAEYESVTTAAHEQGINRGNLSSCCIGNRKTCGGFVWGFVNAK